jgi:hypothetical protein
MRSDSQAKSPISNLVRAPSSTNKGGCAWMCKRERTCRLYDRELPMTDLILWQSSCLIGRTSPLTRRLYQRIDSLFPNRASLVSFMVKGDEAGGGVESLRSSTDPYEPAISRKKTSNPNFPVLQHPSSQSSGALNSFVSSRKKTIEPFISTCHLKTRAASLPGPRARKVT